MSDSKDAATGSEEVTQISFHVKSGNDGKYNITVPSTTTIADLKAKLATSEYADTPAERQRLIFSGRVLKDTDTVTSAKIKEGHTLHLVKSAASNARQNPAAAQAPTGSSPAPAANVPTNIAAGTGNNPLAALTGARYAGFHGLPSASSFGADGGMGPPVGPDEMERMLRNPNFLSQMNEMMDNPAFIEMMEQNPMLRDNPFARQMLRDPNYRRILMNPDIMISQLRAQRNSETARSSFPAPGATDNTDTAAGQAGQQTGQAQAGAPPFGGIPPSFAGLFPPAGGQGANPFAALFGTPPAANPSSPSTATSGAQQNSSSTASTTSGNTTTSAPTPPPNPFANLFGSPPAGGDGNNDQFAAISRLMQNPDFLPAMQAMMGMQGGPGGANPGAGLPGGQNPADLYRALGALGGGGGLGGGNPYDMFGSPPPQQPADDRPPEVRYEAQLRQLNDMGFFDFDNNVAALRRSGGSVQGAIEYLLSNP